MPLLPQRHHTPINNRLLATFALPTEAPSMTPHTPRIPIFLHKRRLRIERIAALSAEEMAHVPGSPARDDDFCLDRRLTAAAARGVQFVEIQMAVEAQGGIAIVQRRLAGLFLFLGYY